MTDKSILVVAAAVATAVIASPALAQSRDHTGSVLANYYDPSGQQMWGAWGPPQVATDRSPRVTATKPKQLYAVVRDDQRR